MTEKQEKTRRAIIRFTKKGEAQLSQLKGDRERNRKIQTSTLSKHEKQLARERSGAKQHTAESIGLQVVYASTLSELSTQAKDAQDGAKTLRDELSVGDFTSMLKERYYEDDKGFDWAALGRDTGSLWRCAPPVRVCYGPMTGEALRPMRSYKRRKRSEDVVEERQELTEQDEIDEAEGAQSKRAEQLLDELRVLMETAPYFTLRRRNPVTDEPISDRRLHLIRTLVDPWSFTQTVDNIFYFSFLLPTGTATIELDIEGQPLIAVGLDARSGLDEAAVDPDLPQPTSAELILNIDPPRWRKLIEQYDLREPLLTHRNSQDSTGPEHRRVPYPHQKAGSKRRRRPK